MVNFLQKIQRHLPDVQKIIKCTHTHIFTVKKAVHYYVVFLLIRCLFV